MTKQLPDGFEWPRFEDGAFAKPGDVMCPCSFWENEEIESIVFDDQGFNVKTTSEHIWYVSKGDRLLRPPVLGKDGQEIKFGDTVYGGDGKKWDVLGLRWHEDPRVVEADHEGEIKQLKPEWLTHERPDSWEKLREDVALCEEHDFVCDYFHQKSDKCAGCPRAELSCGVGDVALDIIRRAEKLAGVTGDV